MGGCHTFVLPAHRLHRCLDLPTQNQTQLRDHLIIHYLLQRMRLNVVGGKEGLKEGRIFFGFVDVSRRIGPFRGGYDRNAHELMPQSDAGEEGSCGCETGSLSAAVHVKVEADVGGGCVASISNPIRSLLRYLPKFRSSTGKLV